MLFPCICAWNTQVDNMSCRDKIEINSLSHTRWAHHILGRLRPPMNSLLKIGQCCKYLDQGLQWYWIPGSQSWNSWVIQKRHSLSQSPSMQKKITFFMLTESHKRQPLQLHLVGKSKGQILDQDSPEMKNMLWFHLTLGYIFLELSDWNNALYFDVFSCIFLEKWIFSYIDSKLQLHQSKHFLLFHLHWCIHWYSCIHHRMCFCWNYFQTACCHFGGLGSMSDFCHVWVVVIDLSV